MYYFPRVCCYANNIFSPQCSALTRGDALFLPISLFFPFSLFLQNNRVKRNRDRLHESCIPRVTLRKAVNGRNFKYNYAAEL